MYNYIEYLKLPAETLQKNDATAVRIKEAKKPVAKTESDNRPIITQGHELVKKEKENAERRLSHQGEIEKERKDLQQGLETISDALDYTSPSYWINRNGGDLNTAQSLGLDMVTYIALGGLPGLVRKGAVTLTKRGIVAAPDLLEKLPNILSRSDLEKYGAFRINSQALPSTPLPKGYRVPLEIEVTPIREQLINYYYSPEYKKRLLRAGFSEEEASKRIDALIRNTNTPIINKDLQGVSGLTEISINDPNIAKIYIDGSMPEKERQAAILEELIHASELRGLTLQEVMKNPNYWKLSNEQKKILIKELTELNNVKAAPYNKSLQPEINKNITTELQEYFKYPYEAKARAIGANLGNESLMNEWNQAYKNSSQKINYFNNVIQFGVPVGTSYFTYINTNK